MAEPTGSRSDGVVAGGASESRMPKRRAPFEVPAPEEVPAPLREQMQAYVDRMTARLPVGAAQVALSCWIRLHG